MNNLRISAFEQLGKYLQENGPALQEVIAQAKLENSWFDETQIMNALQAWAKLLTPEKMQDWLKKYQEQTSTVKAVGLILAGNIPMVGFHDVVCTLITGHQAHIKLSSSDSKLIPHLLEVLTQFEPSFREQVVYVDRLNHVDAVIATGSNNSARYFEHYFGKKPHIIRKNRSSVAIIRTDESEENLRQLGHDIFQYYGQGCRNVSKIFLPQEFDIAKFYEAIKEYDAVVNHHKYCNNYDYYKSIYLVNREEHFDNGFLLLKESEQLHAPLSVLYFEHYQNQRELNEKLNDKKEEIQCVVASPEFNFSGEFVNFGQTQSPGWSDYADRVDTMKFLLAL